MEQLLEFFIHIADNPEVVADNPEAGLESILNLPQFRGVFWYFSEYRGKKPNFCPTCYIQDSLTKHHIIPKKNGGKGVLDNYFYICRPCHDKIHHMISKQERIQAYLVDHPDADEDELMCQFNASRETVIEVLRPELYAQQRKKYESRLNEKIRGGIAMLECPLPC